MAFGRLSPRIVGFVRSPGSRRMLQLCVIVGAVVPVLAGVAGVIDGADGSASHARYLSGLLLAIGIGFWSTVRGIERKAQLFRQLTLLVFGGGLCRLLGVTLGDGFGWIVAGPLLMELVVTPLLCIWQAQLAEDQPFIVPAEFRSSVRRSTAAGAPVKASMPALRWKASTAP
jgi:Domain of unknown function (DUF4345)